MVDFFPVHHVPPRGEILRPAIVVLQVIGVLPYVVAEDRIKALGERIILVRRADDLYLAARLASEPCPAAAELFDARIVELGFEIVEVAEAFLDDVGNRPTRVPATLRLHDL